MNRSGLPYFTKGPVVKGFGRGSKQLGCPTANFPDNIVNELPDGIETGVYFGFAQVDKGDVHKMVMSIGWNPFYQNKTKSMETHIMHEYESDFYDQELKIIILGFLRPEKNFNSLNELIIAIKSDIAQSNEKLDQAEFAMYKHDPFFSK